MAEIGINIGFWIALAVIAVSLLFQVFKVLREY